MISPQNLDPARRTHMNTVTCVICQAAYAPSRLHEYLLLAPPVALESAFMSMCHFCFRCRRPACPQCWDDVHGVCGACSQDANLPFRVAPTPLRGLLFPPAQQVQKIRDEHEAFPLICIHYGRFHDVRAEDEEEVATNPEPLSRESSQRERFDVEDIDTRPMPPDYVVEMDTQPPPARPRRSFGRRVEHILTLLVLAVVIAIVSMVLLALFVPGANGVVMNILHVDIRTEIAYLWQLIIHLH
ncbi:MAG TPA: hypothetical protein VH593_12970 [Ktedonobacteraceae bacterium]